MALNIKTAELKGLKEVMDNLNKEIEKIKGASLDGLLEAGLLIKAESMELCPIVTGNLMNSAFVTWGYASQAPRSTTEGGFRDPVGRKGIKEIRQAELSQGLGASASRVGSSLVPMVEIGHAAVYAVAVHENKRSGQTGGWNPSHTRKYKPKTFATTGQYKFLQTAIQENEGRILEIIKSRVKIP